jgi:hypothetical protein
VPARAAGHASPTVTLNVYARLLPGQQEENDRHHERSLVPVPIGYHLGGVRIKRALSLNPGWVAEWLKAPVLKTECGRDALSCLVPLSPAFCDFLTLPQPGDTACSRILPCCSVPIRVPKNVARARQSGNHCFPRESLRGRGARPFNLSNIGGGFLLQPVGPGKPVTRGEPRSITGVAARLASA